MIEFFKKNVSQFLSKGHERSVRVKRNIIYSFFLKGLTILIGLILIPLTIDYVNTTQYGIWLTLSSIIGWFSFFDIGLGHGLRNKIAESNANGDYEKSRVYVSTTYAALIGIALLLFLVFFFINNYIDWTRILNINEFSNEELIHLTLLLFFIFCLQFVIQNINTILTACHEPSKTSLINFISSLASLLIIFLLKMFVEGSLFYLIVVMAGVPILVQLFASFYFFNSKYKFTSPTYNLIKFQYAKDLLNIGGVFFLIQIGALVLFQTDNIIITQILGPQYVTTFNVAYKLFSVFIMIFTIIITPYWSAFTEAYTKKEYIWIRDNLKKMRLIWLALSVLTLLLLIPSKWIYKVWVGEVIEVPFVLSLAMAIYVIACIWQTLHVYLLNGIGKIKLQLVLVIISSIINIPLAIYLGKVIGLAGVITANTIVFAIMGLIFYFQCERIIIEGINEA